MVQADTRIDVDDLRPALEEAKSQPSWHIPRPSLVARSEKSSDNSSSSSCSWRQQQQQQQKCGSEEDSSSRGSSTASSQSAASGTLLLTAANLASLAALHPPSVGPQKQLDAVSQASSTHFTVVNGLGRQPGYRKSWCARNQLTVLVCSMTLLFMLALLAGILYLEVRATAMYN